MGEGQEMMAAWSIHTLNSTGQFHVVSTSNLLIQIRPAQTWIGRLVIVCQNNATDRTARSMTDGPPSHSTTDYARLHCRQHELNGGGISRPGEKLVASQFSAA